MAINKASCITFKLSYLALLGYLQLLAVCGNELYMKNVMTSTNEVNKLTTSDKPLFFKILHFKRAYYIEASLGTPIQEVHMHLDTGGTQPWIPCSNHQVSRQKWNGFHPSISSSFQTIFCNSNLCKPYQLSWLTCNFDHPVPCNFSEIYYDGENEVGFLSQDAFAFSNHDIQIPNLTFGCIYKEVESYRLENGWIMGRIGLNPQPGSAFDQMKFVYGSYPIMSYCLASPTYDKAATSWMSFGGQNTKNLSFAPLVGPDDASFFSVNLKGITVENVDVDLSNITTLTYDPISKVGGFILDTGSIDTWLPEPLYSRFINTFLTAMKDKTGFDIDFYNRDDYNVCYVFDSDIHISNIKVPNVTFHFENDVHLHLGFENLLINGFVGGVPTKDEEQFWCLAFQKTKRDEDYLIIGNILQQNFHVEIDYQHRKVGFGPLACKSLKV